MKLNKDSEGKTRGRDHMAKGCSICRHDERAQIDQALLDGEPYRNIANRTGTSTSALYRHRRQHLPDRLENTNQSGAEIKPESFRERFDAIKRATSTILDQSLTLRKHPLALQVIARMEKQLKLEAEFQAKLPSSLIDTLGLRMGATDEEKLDLDLLPPDDLRTILALLEKAKRPKAA